MSDVNEKTVLSMIKTDRQATLDLMHFNRIPHKDKIKYEDGFVPPEDHDKWVERQISKDKKVKGPSVRSSIRDAFEELTEERALFAKLDGKVELVSKVETNKDGSIKYGPPEAKIKVKE